MGERPGLPGSDTPRDLGFTRQPRMVPWLSPTQLIGTGLRVFLSETFGSYSDKREILAALPELSPITYTESPEAWVDYIADLGDAFEPTYAMASLLARRQLTIPGADLQVSTPRGQVLVMGGDEVYPTASVRAYENQTVGPYRAALPYVEPEAAAPHLYAIPGNHDWYDGLTAFVRTFCRGQWVGGWKTQQTRSYFAMQLPQRWWLWGIDVQFDSYIDEPQFRYFADTVAKLVQPGDSVILCTPTPAWVAANEEEGEEAYVTIDYFERKVVRGACQAEVRLMITGDSHHYARYEQTDGTAPSPSSEGRSAQSPSSEGRSAQSPSSEGRSAQKITAGGGGAFLSATHNLPTSLVLPPPESRDPGKSDPPTYWRLAERHPSKADSARLRWRAFRLPFENRGLWVLIGLIHLGFAWMAASSRQADGRFSEFLSRVSYGGLVRALAHTPLAILVAMALVWGLAGFTKTGVAAKKWGLGGSHAVGQMLAILVSIAVAARICSAMGLTGLGFDAVFVVLAGTGGGLLGCEVMAVYLLVADRFGLNDNELFAAQRNRDWKNFVRMHVGRDGALTVYPVAVDHTPRRWHLRKGGTDDDPWFEPDGGPVEFKLIEAPIRIEAYDPRNVQRQEDSHGA